MVLNPEAPHFVPFQTFQTYYPAVSYLSPPFTPPPQHHYPLTSSTILPPLPFSAFQELLYDDHPYYSTIYHSIPTPDGTSHPTSLFKSLPPAPPLTAELFPVQVVATPPLQHQFPNLESSCHHQYVLQPKDYTYHRTWHPDDLQQPDKLILIDLAESPTAAPPSESAPVQRRTKLSIGTTESVKQARMPVISGPRISQKGTHPRFHARGRKKEKVPPEKRFMNENKPIIARVMERNYGGSNEIVRCEKEEIITLGKGEKTTSVMIKNVPNKYTRRLLMQMLDKYCNLENKRAQEEGEKLVSAYDFLYLPIDFNHRLNKGYAFVNFTDPKAVWKFYNAFNGKSWELFISPKIAEIVSAKLQGKEALVSHFEKSNFCCDSEEYLPVWFDPPRDGSGEPVKINPVGRHHPKNCAELDWKHSHARSYF